MDGATMRTLSVAFCGLVLAGVLTGCGPSVDEVRGQAISQYQVGHYPEAENLFNQVLQRRPIDAESWYYLGRIAHAEKWYIRAMQCYEQSLRADPGYRPAQTALEQVKQDLGPDMYEKLKTNPDLNKTIPYAEPKAK